MQVQCEKCEEIIAVTKPDRLRLPIDSSMFDPRTPEEFSPWPAFEQWVGMRCPICGNCPFTITEELAQGWVDHKGLGPEQVKTPLGFFKVGDVREPGEVAERVVEIFDDDELEREWQERASTSVATASTVTTMIAEPNPAKPKYSPKKRPGKPPKRKDAK